MQKKISPAVRGFTLIELLVVISIIGMLASIVFSSLISARLKARVGAGLEADASLYHGVGDHTLGEWLFGDCSATTLQPTTINDTGGAHLGARYPVLTPPLWNGPGSGPGGQRCSMAFDGASQYIRVGPVTTGTTLTYSIWIKIASLPSGTQTLIWDDDSAGGGDSWIQLNSNGTVQNVSVFTTTVTSTRVVPTGEWAFITVTGDSTGSRIYINGALSGSSGIPFIAKTPPQGSYVSFGASYDGGSIVGTGQYFAGSIGEVRIYNAALTSADVEKVYAEEAPQYMVAVR